MSFINKLNVVVAILILSLNLYAQKFDGTYKGNFSGDLNGTFEFTVAGSGYSNNVCLSASATESLRVCFVDNIIFSISSAMCRINSAPSMSSRK